MTNRPEDKPNAADLIDSIRETDEDLFEEFIQAQREIMSSKYVSVIEALVQRTRTHNKVWWRASEFADAYDVSEPTAKERFQALSDAGYLARRPVDNNSGYEYKVRLAHRQ